MVMDLRLEEVLLVGAGTAPTVAVKSDPGAAVPSTVAALEGCSHKYIFWFFKEMLKIRDRAPLIFKWIVKTKSTLYLCQSTGFK